MYALFSLAGFASTLLGIKFKDKSLQYLLSGQMNKISKNDKYAGISAIVLELVFNIAMFSLVINFVFSLFSGKYIVNEVFYFNISFTILAVLSMFQKNVIDLYEVTAKEKLRLLMSAMFMAMWIVK